jgi:NitT/TauT family transport system permease protein
MSSAASPSVKLQRIGQRLAGFGIPAGGVTSLLVVWWLVHLVYPVLVPSPWTSIKDAWDLIAGGVFAPHMLQTLKRVLVGFSVSMVFAIAIGIIMGTVRPATRFFQPLVVIGLTIPGLIIAFLSIMLFGLSEITPYFAVAVTIFPMLVINIWQGVSSMDKDLIDMSTAIGLSSTDKVKHVILPQLTTPLLAATRYGLGLAWKVVVLVEMFATGNGVGFQIMAAYENFSMRGVLSWTITFVLAMMLIEYGIIGLIEKPLTAWRPKAEVWRR